VSELRDSLASAIVRLDEALAAPQTSLTRDAAIQRFEFCVELAWKFLQKRLRDQGVSCASPRGCLKEAHSQGWIEEGPWLAMLQDRNLTSHTYDEQLAMQVYSRLAGYLPPLNALLAALP